MTNEIGEDESATGGRRTGVKIAIATFALALAGAGIYAVAGGGSPEATAAGSKTSVSKTDTKKADDKKADETKDDATATLKPTASATPKPSKAPELPSAKNMSKAELRAALIAYLKEGDFPLTDDSSPATAAKAACDLLDGGMKRAKLASDLSKEAEVSKDLGEYFLVGATHFYCSKHSVSS